MTDADEVECADALTEVKQLLRTNGLRVAYDAGLQILADPKSPAQARSATLNAFFRAGGLFDRGGDSDPDDELTPQQIAAAIEALERQAREQAGAAIAPDPLD